MIPRVSVLVLGATICTAVAQDWVVNFNNANLPSNTAHPDRLVRSYSGGPGLVGTNYQAILLYGAPGSSLTPAQPPARFRVPTTLSPGTWQGGDRTLTGMGNTPGTQVQMQVAVFDINQFASYAAAVAGRGILGRSSLFTYTIPAPPLAPDAADLVNFDWFIMPEPTVPALGVVGALVLWMARGRVRTGSRQSRNAID